MSKILSVGQVFIAGGLPTVTYNPRTNLDLEGKLRDALTRLNKIVLVAGPTKSGKTVLVRKVLPTIAAIWVDGGAIRTEADFWTNIAANLGLSLEQSTTVGTANDETSQTDGGLEVKPFGVGISGKRTVSQKASTSNTTAFKTIYTARTASIESLMQHGLPLVVDDFHYIPREIQTNIIRALKQPVFDGLKVVLLAVPHRTADAVKAESEVEGRVTTILVPDWQDNELKEIAAAGFIALNLTVDEPSIDELVHGSFSSPHLLQDLCSLVCKNNKIVQTSTVRSQVIVPKPTSTLFQQLARDMSPTAFTKMRKGPDRATRIPRNLKNGNSCDIYEAVLWSIIETGPTAKIVYNDVISNIKDMLIQSAVPQQHEITRVLEQMAKLAQEVSETAPPLDYDKEFKEMHITDPFFRFFLKWGVERDWRTTQPQN
ncbi:ATP-binding protein [Burkholderia gladioli]|uniref:ATP-binding protein n=1 Tax=Burkholderia gladioli TaxID=28095 RepID=UPI0016409661|nr:ATP-binding protein [Burkholderia gladioli]